MTVELLALKTLAEALSPSWACLGRILYHKLACCCPLVLGMVVAVGANGSCSSYWGGTEKIEGQRNRRASQVPLAATSEAVGPYLPSDGSDSSGE